MKDVRRLVLVPVPRTAFVAAADAPCAQLEKHAMRGSVHCRPRLTLVLLSAGLIAPSLFSCGNHYSPWDDLGSPDGSLSCPYSRACPATALCELVVPSVLQGPDNSYSNCAPMPPGCAVGHICACSPWFTPDEALRLTDGGVRVSPEKGVCYYCREQVIDASRTSVSCEKYISIP